MKKEMIIKYIVIICFLLFCLLIGNDSYALEDVDNYSELYKQYLALSDEEKANVSVIPEKYNTSLNNYNSTLNQNALSNIDVPQRYNLAEHYDIKVENQGQEGNCWSFASLETLETYLQLHGYGTFDFSENHLNYIESNLFSETDANRNINTSGSYSEFQEYVNKSYGPVSEKDFPYYKDEIMQIHKDYTEDELESLLNVTPLAYVGEYVNFPSISKNTNTYSDEELSEYRKKVKKHIIDNGAVYTLIVAPSYFTEEFYNDHTYAAYFPNTTDPRFMERLHSVAIIGWDDNFSKENFAEANRPEHDGAYIALNSWGRQFGNDGLYYISYDDAYVETQLFGIKEAVTDKSLLKNTKTVKLNDVNLYNALKNNLGRKLTSYNDNMQTITILNGILNEITFLDLSNNNITDLSGIENFTNLRDLKLEHNNISSIRPLLSLHNLNYINLNYNKLTTVPIEIKQSTLMQLTLAYNPIVDFSGLQEAKSIVNLDLEGTSITENDLNYLKNLKIVNLNLANTNVKDYTTLNNLEEGEAALQVLNINHNNDIVYTSIPKVTSLDISHTNINEDKFNLIPYTNNLQHVNISYTNIKNIGIIPVDQLQIIDISGNKNLINIDTIKNVGSVIYRDAELDDLSIFAEFTTRELNLTSNNITDYSTIANNGNIGILDLSNNKIDSAIYLENTRVFLDGNNVKPVNLIPENVITIKDQKYTQTLRVDPSRDNIFSEIATELKNLHQAGIKLEITNAIMDYDNNIFKIQDYNKDVVIKITNGQFSGSTITYKLEKIDNSNIIYIYIDRSKIKNMYIEGESIDPSQIKVYACYDNDSSSQITDFSIEGGENLTIGENTITIKKGNLSDCFTVNGISRDSIVELTFNSKDIYNAVLSKIAELEKERAETPQYYENIKILIDNDDTNKSIKILKADLKNISYLEIVSNELTNLEDIKQLKGLCGISINGKNLEDLSALRTIKTYLDDRDDLMGYEKFLGLTLKNNEKITSIDDDIFRSLELSNTKISNINNLRNLKSVKITDNKIPEMDEIIDNLRMITIDVSDDIKNANKDPEGNVILPEIFKTYKNKGFEIKAYICDQIRDEQYLNAFNKKELEVKELNNNIIIKYDDLKDLDYNGKNQFVEISILDKDYIYSNFEFKYRLNYKLLESLELGITDPVEVEEDTIPDLSNLVVYKVYSNKQKEQISNFEYTKAVVTKDMKEIEISYTESGITKSINVPINVIDHTHEWGEWKVTKEPTKTEEGQKERVCLKNEGHKQIAKIEKLSENQYEIIEGANQIYIIGDNGATFRINADYSLFENGGKVFVDGNETKNYIAKSGSTIITLNKEYVDSLSEGEHTLKVTFNDKGEATTKFTVAKKIEKSSAEIESEEISNISNSGNPKTGDSIAIYFSLIIISMLGIVLIVRFIIKMK